MANRACFDSIRFMTPSSGSATALTALALIAGACGGPSPVPRDSGTDASVASDAGALPSGRCLAASPMDLLIVVDTTNSMDEEQQAFAAALPALFDVLTDPSLDPEHPPVEDMHV